MLVHAHLRSREVLDESGGVVKWTLLLGPISPVVKRIPSDSLRDKIWALITWQTYTWYGGWVKEESAGISLMPLEYRVLYLPSEHCHQAATFISGTPYASSEVFFNT